jgi:ribosome maturation factor RimP
MISKEYIENILKNINDIDFFIVDIKISPNQKISIHIDNQEGITISQCQEIHKKIYPLINEKTENFELEISSPGLSNNLKVWQQYSKIIGQEIKITDIEGQTYTGEILQANEKEIKIKKADTEKTLTYKQIKKAKQILKF